MKKIYHCIDSVNTVMLISIDDELKIARVLWNSEDRWEYNHTASEVEDDSSWEEIDYNDAVINVENVLTVIYSVEVEQDEEPTETKRVFVAAHGNTDWVDDKVTFDKDKAMKAADMVLYHLTPAEKKTNSVTVTAYDILCYEGETAEEAYNRVLLDGELPESVEVEEVSDAE